MHLGLNRFRSSLLLGFSIGILFSVLAFPLWRTMLMHTNQSSYGELTYLCDSAMRSHYLAKMKTSETPSTQTIRALEQSEIALIDCQDYDLLQKKLKLWGLRENELGYMRLKAIENDAKGLKDVIDAHEIRN